MAFLGIGKKKESNKPNGQFEYNTHLAPGRKEALRDRYTRTLLINSTWYGGNDLELKKLYQRDLKSFKVGEMTSDELNYFWATNTDGLNVRKIHSGIPQLISEKMVDLIMSNGYEWGIYLDDTLTDRDEESEQRLAYMLDENTFNTQLHEAIETESWSGGVAFKLSVSKKYPFPILEVIQPEEYEFRVEAGRIVEDIFIKYFHRGDVTYKLKEHYGIGNTGGYIRYELYKLSGETWTTASLSELEETKDLKDHAFTGIYEKFSLYKPNKLPNSEFRGSKLGESDYSGSHGLFDAIDEVISTMIQEFRDGKIKNFWPSDLLPVDVDGKVYMQPSLKKDFIIFNSGIGEKEKPTKPEMVQGDIHSEKYIETYKKLMESVLNNAGLSPQTVGVTGLESTSASESSQELREKTSIRTREKKVAMWEKTLNKLFELMLKLDDYRMGKAVIDYTIKTIFNDYKIQTISDKTSIATAGIAGKSWDIKSAVDYIHDDLTEEEKVLMRVNIKIENGINVFTKEEEFVYKKFVQETLEEIQPPAQEQSQEVEETEEVEETDVIE